MTPDLDEQAGYQPGHILSRSSREGFAERTLKNLAYIEEARAGGEPADVHVVTQLVLSMLGLVVIQWERQAFDSALASGFQRTLQKDLHQFGGPALHGMQDNYAEKCKTVGVLVRHLRNAVSHGRFIFSGESRNLEDVSIKFFDEYRRTGETWTATIDGVDLREFCIRLARSIPI
jgi:HEPN pEK499 p136